MSGRRPTGRCCGEIEDEIDALSGGGGDGASLDSDRRLHEEREFVAHAVHELRSPLAILQGVHYLLDRDHAATAKATGQPPEARSKRHLALLGEAIQSLSSQVDRLLDLQAVAPGAQTVSPASLVTVLTATAERSTLAQGNQPRLHWHIDPEVPEDTPVDGGRLTIALRNLIGNALKYSLPSARVDVTVGPAGSGRLRIEVRDRGRGVPVADRDRLGEPYFRASNTSGTPGTGLGLCVVQRAVESMGGCFGYQTPPAGEPGAIFWLEFPALRESSLEKSPVRSPCTRPVRGVVKEVQAAAAKPSARKRGRTR